MRSILASDAEARAAARGELRLVVRPVKAKVDADYVEHAGGALHEYVPVKNGRIGPIVLLCPLGHPGDVVAVREKFLQPLSTWQCPSGEHESYWAGGPGDIRYAADDAQPEWTRPGTYGSPWRAFRPSVHMPLDAVRSHLRVTSVEVRRVTTITEAEARAAGHEMAFHFAAEWVSRFARKGAPFAEAPWAWFVSVESAEVSR